MIERSKKYQQSFDDDEDAQREMTDYEKDLMR